MKSIIDLLESSTRTQQLGHRTLSISFLSVRSYNIYIFSTVNCLFLCKDYMLYTMCVSLFFRFHKYG